MFTKQQLANLTYDEAERLYLDGYISEEAWNWYCWKFGQTSLALCAHLRGKPEPEYPDDSDPQTPQEHA